MSAPAPHSRARGAFFVVTVAAWFALTTGLSEAGVLGVRHFLFRQFIWTSHHIGWLAPLSYLAFILPPALGLALVAAVRPRWVPPPAVAGAAAALAVGMLTRLVSLQRIHPLAITILAVGVGVHVARLVHARPAAWRRLVSRTLPVLAATVVALAGITITWGWLDERHASSRLGAIDPAAPPLPNILLLLLDTVRAANLGLYGYGRPTSPALDALGARGVVFDRALATAPWTLPSHGSLFTGRNAFELSAGFLRPLDATHPTLAEALSARGYVTAGFVANHWYTGWESGLARGFAHYRDYRLSLRQLALSSELGQLLSDYRSRLILRTNHAHSAADINDEFLEWLPRSAGRPFFAFLNYFDAHLPYRTPGEYERRFAAGRPVVDRYDAAIAYLDAQIGALLDTLGRRGVLRNTIVLVTADHGELLGEHGMDNHGNALYQQLLHVPLIIAGTGVPAAKRVASSVTLRDFAATVLDLAGQDRTVLPGRSLARHWTATVPRVDSLIVAHVERHPTAPAWYRNRTGAMWTVVAGQWQLIRNPDGGLELYDWWADTGETRDLAASPAGRTSSVLAALARALDSTRATAAPATR